jgi:hypothetical protein
VTTSHDTNPTETYAAAAAAARAIADECNPVEPAHKFGRTLADLFETLGDEQLRLGALPPRVRQLGLDVARLFLAVHRVDQDNAAAMEAAALAGNPYAVALGIMQTNEGITPPGSAPRILASAFVDLIMHAVDPETELDAEVDGLLRRLCSAIVAVDQADAAEADERELYERDQLGPGEFPIGVFADGTIAAGSVPGAMPLTVAGKTNLFPEIVAQGLAQRLGDQLDDIRQGRDFAVALGVDVPEGSTRFRMRSGPVDPTRIDVYDEQGERCAIITETRDGSEWRCSVLTAVEARSMDTISFPRAVEHLDAVLAAAAGDR